MANKVYVKDGVGFEGISMMTEEKSHTPKIILGVLGTLLVIALIGFVASQFISSEKISADQQPAITILPTSSRNAADTAVITEEQEEPTSTPEITPTISPTKKVTATPTISKTITPTSGKTSPTISSSSKSSVEIEVLNGSGTKGAAKRMSAALTEAGYTVARTGNADSFSYSGITVEVKTSKKQLLDQLKKDLSAADYLVTKTTTTLPKTEPVDVVIIVGEE